MEGLVSMEDMLVVVFFLTVGVCAYLVFDIYHPGAILSAIQQSLAVVGLG